MNDSDNQLINALLERGLLKPQQAQELEGRAQAQGMPLASLLLKEKTVSPEAITQIQAEMAGIPYVDLSKTPISDGAMEGTSRKAAATYRFMPFAVQDNKLLVAMENPTDFQALEAIQFIAKRRGLTAEIYQASGAALEKALGGSSAVVVEIGGALQDFSKELEEAATIEGGTTRDIEHIMEEAPVTKVVAVMIRHAIEGHASDIHVEPTENSVRVRYRVDGKLHTSLVLPLKVHAAIISRIKILSNLKIDESRLPQDGRFSATVDKRAFDFRVATMPTTFGEKAAMRILDKSTGAPSFDELGMRSEEQMVLKENLYSPHGIILMSGPTGAGKSTTLFTCLSLLNAIDVNIVTLEDPVEYEVEGVNQTQVHPEIGLSFASGLRSILRQDPDIIMVGEIRDKETAELSVHASLTGHLVLSTIHTNDAVGVVPRLIDMGIDPFLLAASLRLLAAQRLVGRLCQQCKREIPLSNKVRDEVVKALATVPEKYKTEPNQRNPKVLYEAVGCPACQETGVTGRLGIFEIIPINRELRAAINNSATYDTLVTASQGRLTMQQDGLLKALAGLVPYEDVLRVTSES
jgi:type IV pilus assembly protein PilB